MERRTDAHRRHDERRASAVPESGQRRVQNLRRYAYNSLLSSFFLSRMDRKFIQSLTFNVILLIITIITHISQALVTGKRSYIESRLSCCCCCVCCHCFSSGVKIKREREREKTRELSNFDLLLGKHSFCCVSVECETARSFVRNVDVAPFHQLSSSSLL